ncbi:hypothetical protein [Polaromonas sp.]|uniref:hypothetical protein n=1 Tax=Polaromonas sp. TaxID=1869339 RepID=UPI003BB7993C
MAKALQDAGAMPGDMRGLRGAGFLAWVRLSFPAALPGNNSRNNAASIENTLFPVSIRTLRSSQQVY